MLRQSYFDTLTPPPYPKGNIYLYPSDRIRAHKSYRRASKPPTGFGWHRASAPGQRPAPLTGRLRTDVRLVITRDKKNGRFLLRLYPQAPYASLLETGGTAHITHYIYRGPTRRPLRRTKRIRVAPRPFLKSVLHKRRTPIKKIIDGAIDIIRFAAPVKFPKKWGRPRFGGMK